MLNPSWVGVRTGAPIESDFATTQGQGSPITIDNATDQAYYWNGSAVKALKGGLFFFTPEQFLAKGDGLTNDTVAFQNLATAINNAGGGVISFRPGATYLVGQQSLVNDGTYMFKGVTIFRVTALTRGFTILGNGAKIKLFDGYYFGTFNSSGVAIYNPMPYYGVGETSTPLSGNGEGIITIQNCTGPIHLENFEIDGNLGNAKIGGQKGDTGWQIEGDGLIVSSNTVGGGETVKDVYCHHCPRDGILISNTNATGTVKMFPTRSKWSNVESYRNGRQGLSMGGGRRYDFEDCKFHETGRATNPTISGSGQLSSAPAAGVDVEAEFGPIRDISFKRCFFGNTVGAAFVADSGDSEGIEFEDCDFVGVDIWSAWLNKPRIRATNSRFIGSVTHVYADADPTRAAQFRGCLFTNDPATSPYSAAYSSGNLLDMNTLGQNVLLDNCSATTISGNFSNGDSMIFRDCNIASGGGFCTNPRFEGHNVLSGFVNAYMPGHIGTHPRAVKMTFVEGATTYNEIYSSTVTYAPPSLAAGASTTTTVKVLGAYIGDRVDVSFDQLVPGLRFIGEVSTSAGGFTGGTITVTLTNTTAGTVALASGNLRVGITSAKAISA